MVSTDEWEADVLLADGGTMHVRPIRPGDQSLIESFHTRQSSESIYYRYFSPRPTLSHDDLERLTHLDYHDRMAFVGLLGDDLVGIARYDRYPASNIAEVAFFTDDAHRGRGMATVLLEYLAAAAREAGLSGFVAQVLPENRRMLSVFSSAGFEVRSQFSDGVIEVELGIEPTDAARSEIDERARLAASRSMSRILAPASIAVIGVSEDPESIGTRVVRHLEAGGFTGSIHPIGLHASTIGDLDVHRSIGELDLTVDVAVVCVPAPAVRQVVADCGRHHVHGLVIISAGFDEPGAVRAPGRSEMISMARRMGMRVIGPASMGVVNTSPSVSMHATFVDVHPLAGSIAVSSQSGTLGAAIIEHAARRNLGISSFVAFGDRSDVSNNDLLQYWEDDPDTSMVLLYLEDFGNPSNFTRITRRLCRRKPVVAVKSGGSRRVVIDGVGFTEEASVDALLARTGMIRVDTLVELFDVAKVLATQPVPGGRRLAIVSNSSGPARLAVDAARGVGLELASFAHHDRKNPVDLGFSAEPHDFAAAVRAVGSSPDVDVLLVLCTPPMTETTVAFAEAIERAADDVTIPVVATYLGLPHGTPGDVRKRIPVFAFPESAVQALGRAARYGEWLSQDPGRLLDETLLDRATIDRLTSGLAVDRAVRTDRATTQAILAAAGATVVDQRQVSTADAAVEAADQVGWPVALKAAGIDRPAKTEAGGVAVDLHDVPSLRRAHARMSGLLGQAMDTAVVQHMVPAGLDVRIAVARNDLVGAVVSLEVDRTQIAHPAMPALAVLPCTDTDASSMLQRSGVDRALSELPTIRDAARARTHLADLVCRLSTLVDICPDVSSIVLEQVIVSQDHAWITDARLTLTPTHRSDISELRHLPIS